MYLLLRARKTATVYETLKEAVAVAVSARAPVWIWQMECDRFGRWQFQVVTREVLEANGCRDIANLCSCVREASPMPVFNRLVRKARRPVALTTPRDVFAYLREHVYTPWAACQQEEMWVLLLNSRLIVTHEVMVYRGTIDAVHARPAEVFREAVLRNRPGVIVAHNHPSGACEPSEDDIVFTERLCQAARLLDITLQDHLVVGESGWTSLHEKGWI